MIGFIGGTGPEGKGLALRFALAGEAVLIGSREIERASQATSELLALTPRSSIAGEINDVVASRSDVVFIVVPYEGHKPTLNSIKKHLTGKIVVDVVAPMTFTNGIAVSIPVAEGSAALEAKAILPDSTVVAAFQTISAFDLKKIENPVESDVVVCGEDMKAREFIMGLAQKIPGVRAVDGGGLINAGYVENLTPLLVNINRRYKAHSAIKITGI